MTVNQRVAGSSPADQRSKHYYMGTQRVATDIGVDYGMSPSPEQTESARGGDDAAMTEATQGLETDQVPFQSLGYEQDLERVLLGLSGEIGVEDLSEALAPIERFYPELSNPVNSGEGIESEPPLYIGTRIMYWYHPDYVSNVDMVTDKSGEAYELFLYNAWGESLHHWSSSSTNSWSSPYRFNSKELDSETGMHYYGARYHHPKLSVWMSVDPLAHQTLEAYQFTGNNPIALIDPNGEDVEILVGKPYTKNGKDHPYGHVALRVYGEGYDYIYDFGRYGDTWGLIGAGDGILNVYKNSSNYLNSEQRIRETVGFAFSTTAEADKKIIEFYKGLAEAGEVYKQGAVPGGGGTAYKLEENYAFLSNNCTTMSSDGLMRVGLNYIEDEIDPRKLLESLDELYEELGAFRRTEYLKGGDVRDTYLKPQPNASGKTGSNNYEDKPIPKLKDPE